MARYEWPPRPIVEQPEATQRLADALERAYEDLEAERVRVLESPRMGRKRLVDAWLKEFQAALAVFAADTTYHVERFVTLHLNPRYLAGIVQGGGQAAWTAFHSQAFTSLALDTYTDFLQRSEEAMETSADFANAVRAAASETIPTGAAGGRTIQSAARAWAQLLSDEYDITHVVYANGARVPVKSYTLMASLTKSAVAFNTGTLNECTASGVRFVEVFDGTDCGWTHHESTDKANGSIRHVDDATANPISHPRCQRAFGPRPDVTTKAQAKAAQASTTPEQRADQAEIDYDPNRDAIRATPRVRARASRMAARTARG